MIIVLALCAALGYGVSDFAGGIAARQTRPTAVLRTGYPAGTLLMAGCLPWCPGSLTGRALLMASAAGLCGVVGLAMLYRLMAAAPLHVVSPISAVMAATLPLAFGIAVAGEHPSAMAGLGLTAGLVAVVLINSGPSHVPSRVGPRVIALAMVCGGCFGAYFVLIAQAGNSAGITALLVARVTGSLALFLAGRHAHGAGRTNAHLSLTSATAPPPVVTWPTGTSAAARPNRLAVAAGLADAAADVCFLLATRGGDLSISGIVAAQYPVVTVLLALTVLRERTGWRPMTGLGLTAISVALLAR